MKFKGPYAEIRTPILDFLFGRPLSFDEGRKERVGPAAGIPVFGLDALASSAYGPEAALTILLPLGILGVNYVVPISLSIIVLLTIVYFSYRQTIAAYPSGGGSYIVASENLGPNAGLLAASALMIDYMLDCAVGISAGVGALVSAVPSLQPHTLGLCLAILVLLTLINLRGVREAGGVFMTPTYVFVGCLLVVIGLGLYKAFQSGGHPTPVYPLPPPPLPTAAVSTWLLLKAFASGCTAMTGVEAVSNGVQAFKEPVVHSARKTLSLIISILIVLLAGIAYLVRAYGITATSPGQPGYRSVLSMLTEAVAGRGTFYYFTIGSILVVLALSANTAFADFPRLCRSVAANGYLPYFLTWPGRRFVYTTGVLTLVTFTGSLLIIFGGVTDRLIPLFAVGAFLAFTLSQAGMVQHWRRTGGKGARLSMLINGFGAIATGITLCVIIVAKFTEGAWITVLIIPTFIFVMASIHRHYDELKSETVTRTPLSLKGLHPPVVVVPIDRWSKVSQKALRFAYVLSTEIQVLHVDYGDPETQELRQMWSEIAEEPVRQTGHPPPELVVISSPHRLVLTPILEYVLELEGQNPTRHIAVLLPEIIERHWYGFLLHNQRANALKLLLYFKGDKRIIVINVPWYVEE